MDGDALERLARYCARPPLSLRRLEHQEDGQVLYHAKHAAPGAPRLLRLSPMQFMGRLAALIPPPTLFSKPAWRQSLVSAQCCAMIPFLPTSKLGGADVRVHP